MELGVSKNVAVKLVVPLKCTNAMKDFDWYLEATIFLKLKTRNFFSMKSKLLLDFFIRLKRCFCLCALTFLFCSMFSEQSFGQSKNDQILLLQTHLDSLNQVTLSMRTKRLSDIHRLNEKIDSLRYALQISEKELSSLNVILNECESDVRTQSQLNDKLTQSINLQMNSIEFLKKEHDFLQQKSDSLESMNSNFSKVNISDLPIESEMVFVEGGVFQMGRDSGDPIGKLAHTAEVSSFYIGKYEVTQAQWLALMGINPSHFSGCDNCPVENVSWTDIQNYISKLNSQTGKNYRIPTEEEWEYAAKGGRESKGFVYSGSNDVGAVAYYQDNSKGKTHSVGEKKPNELGIYDMTGNVWEWCFAESTTKNIFPPSTDCLRLRGGSWFEDGFYSRITMRQSLVPSNYDDLIGFRLVLPAID
jgi:formylglycine-generating enzyme required for sulfatase activity